MEGVLVEEILFDSYSLEEALAYLKRNRPQVRTIADIFRLAKKGELKLSVCISDGILVEDKNYSEREKLQDKIQELKYVIDPLDNTFYNRNIDLTYESLAAVKLKKQFVDDDYERIVLHEIKCKKENYKYSKPITTALNSRTNYPFFHDLQEQIYSLSLKIRELDRWFYLHLDEGEAIDVSRVNSKNKVLIVNYDGTDYFLHHASTIYCLTPEFPYTTDNENICIRGVELKTFMRSEQIPIKSSLIDTKPSIRDVESAHRLKEPIWNDLYKGRSRTGIFFVYALKEYWKNNKQTIPDNENELRIWILKNKDKMKYYDIEGDAFASGLTINETKLSTSQIKQALRPIFEIIK